MSRVRVSIEPRGPVVQVDWDDGRQRGGAHLDEAPGAVPRWIGSADDLLEGADRRSERAVLDALAEWATAEATSVGLFHDDGTVEVVQ